MPSIAKTNIIAAIPGIGAGNTGTQTAVFLNTSADGLTAHAGGTQALGTPITTRVARFTTVATAADSALLPPAIVGMEVTVINSGVAAMNVFPVTGEQINGGGANVAFSVTNAKQSTFRCTTKGLWYCALSN